jgi:hypothetical protein
MDEKTFKYQETDENLPMTVTSIKTLRNRKP